MVRTALVALLLLAGCADPPPRVVQGESAVQSGAPCRPASPVPGSAPDGFPVLPVGSVLTLVTEDTVTGRVEAPREDVLTHFRAALDAAGWVRLGEEDEGAAVKLGFFGSRGDGTLLVASLTCPSGSTGFTVQVRSATGS